LGHRQAQRLGGSRHAAVVRDDAGQVLAELAGGSDVDRVETSQARDVERSGGTEQCVVEGDEIDLAQDKACTVQCVGAVDGDGERDLDPRQTARCTGLVGS